MTGDDEKSKWSPAERLATGGFMLLLASFLLALAVYAVWPAVTFAWQAAMRGEIGGWLGLAGGAGVAITMLGILLDAVTGRGRR